MSATNELPQAGSGTAAFSAEASTSSPAFEQWRKSMAQFTGLGLSDSEQAERQRRLELQTLEKDWDRCEGWKKELMTTSPMIVFLLKHLKMAGCEFPSSAMQCHPCDPSRAGGFSPAHGILLCQNRVSSKKHMEDTLAHELIHAYDHCKFKVDWMNLRHHACTEIRAANLSGDCRWSREVQRGHYAFSKQHQACVKRRAVLSVKDHPNCKSVEDAERAVNEVWDSCFKDTRPFDEIY
ncbi:Mitochondrial inner membrane protease atp23 [Apiotrichum porosum]|uniref:Mitochondrial inner membrane protease ATP23 n=1 Tax=Apiotrichum porosum TaxID=105984 RepID=A0A427XWK6_9TREE|nr:Mitochondrial inner membrane protease atp23 [Apiotrichum porosum]RSH83234.1 Mitochondrial inner membrane protease atp23 [Apiotrichum porosum]